MDINATWLGQTVIISVIVTAILAFIVAKDRVENRPLAAFLGLLGGLVQPIGLIYLIVLFLKQPISKRNSHPG
ncbi:MAG: protein of unknown function DUF2566 [Idiomarinaceae bacterium HL-53]|nr:MAG: protein of unknown function DUF2566 [Idiomarinaceae bacterium HL-53]CUS49336.1 hypothetical protein Ga0003345_2324 [Idiomarinaceae bacterium HL-53]